jgi:adenylate kinase family enzyme
VLSLLLYNLIELDELTRENILLKIHDLTSNVFKNNDPIKNFFYKAQNKFYSIAGVGQIDEIFASLRQVINTL